MSQSINIEAQEKKAAAKARVALKSSIINQIRATFKKRSGNLEKSNATTRFKDARLDRLTIQSPRYSFTQHYGSNKTGSQKATTRSGGEVRSFDRFLNGKNQSVKSHRRNTTTVKAFNKNEPYRATNHLGKALRQTNALETLATELGENRITNITSQIEF